jgi:hypothetical protein
MAGTSATMSIEAVKATIRSIEQPRAEGHFMDSTGGAILKAKDATYKKGK